MKRSKQLFFLSGSLIVLGLTACGTTGNSLSSTGSGVGTGVTAIEAALPLVRTGSAVATGAVLDFTVKQGSTRTRLANEMYSAAGAVYSLTGGTFPTPAQLKASILAFGGSETDAGYAQFASGVSSLYAVYYARLVTGDAKTGSDLLGAIAGGIEDATQAYVTTPAAAAASGA